MEPRFLLMSDVAELLNVTMSQVYHMVRSGELPAIKVGGRGQWRIERSKLEEYIERRQAQPHFANARSIRNALDRARLRQASRLFTSLDRQIARSELMTIEANDIRASRVFGTGELHS